MVGRQEHVAEMTLTLARETSFVRSGFAKMVFSLTLKRQPEWASRMRLGVLDMVLFCAGTL